MMENSSISLGDLQGEKFTVDNENKGVKGRDGNTTRTHLQPAKSVPFKT